MHRSSRRVVRSAFLHGAVVAALASPTVFSPARSSAVEPALARAPEGTPFLFEVIESVDAAYLGDTPSHVGRSGGLEFRPNVALGDPVYRVVGEGEARKSVRIGLVSRVVWERVSGSLTVEVDPDPLVRVAVGDELWIDLNPAPRPAGPGSRTDDAG